MSNKAGPKICQFYNPYWKSGCRDNCKSIHLNEDQYVKYCQNYNELNPPNYAATEKYKKSLNMIQKGMYKQSIGILRDLIAAYPYNEKFHGSLVKCYSKLRMNEGNVAYKRLIAINPSNPLHHRNYAMYLSRGKKMSLVPRAEYHFTKAIELMDNHSCRLQASATHGMFGKFLFEIKKDVNRAQHHFEQSLQIFDDIIILHP